MAFTIVSHGYATYDSTPGTTPAITGLTSAAGDKMVLLIWDYLGTNLTVAANISDSASNTYNLTLLESTVFPGYVAWVDLTSSVTTVSVANSGGAYGNRLDVVAIVLRGAKTGAPGWTAHQYTAGNTMDPGSLTTTGGNTQYFMFGASLGTWVSSSGGNVVETATGRGNIKCLETSGAAGAYQLTQTLTSGNLTAAIAVAFEEAAGSSSFPGDDEPRTTPAPSRTWAAAALALAAMSVGGVDELPQQPAATIVDEAPTYAAPPPLLAARVAPTVAPDESWFPSAYDDEPILCPYRCVGPALRAQSVRAAQAAASMQGPHEDLWCQSTPDDAPTSTWAPPPVAWLYAEETAGWLTTAPDELAVAVAATIVDDESTWTPAPPPYVLLYAEEAAQNYAVSDESWFAAAVDDEAATVTAPPPRILPLVQSAPDDDLPVAPVATIVDEDGAAAYFAPPRILPPLPVTADDESWFASAVDEDAIYCPVRCGGPLARQAIVSAAQATATLYGPGDEVVPIPGVFGLDDEATQPVTPPRFDQARALATAALPTFADELYFQSTPDDEAVSAYPPPPVQRSAVQGAADELPVTPATIVDDEAGSWPWAPRSGARLQLSAVDEFAPQLIVDDDAVGPVTPPRFDLARARAGAAAFTFADELWFASAVDEGPLPWPAPPLRSFAGPAIAALGCDEGLGTRGGGPYAVDLFVTDNALSVASLELVDDALMVVELELADDALYTVEIEVT